MNFNNGTHRIVLTGGPGGGKTTAADLIRREIGDSIIVVPEAATMLFCGGFPRISGDIEAIEATQKSIFHVQRNIEDIQHSRYPGRVLLCDRGTVDGVAYWPNADTDFLELMGSSFNQELTRYDAVIFFETAAKGNMSIEGGNPSRIEDNQKAIELDSKLKAAWSQHPNFYHIPHQKSFMKKLHNALDVFYEVMSKLDRK